MSEMILDNAKGSCLLLPNSDIHFLIYYIDTGGLDTMSKTDKKAEEAVGVKDPFDPTRWGIPRRATREIAQEFEVFFREFHNCFNLQGIPQLFQNSHLE